MRVLVAMSGGVDSSVVACLLKKQGHDVVGVRFQLWQDPLAPAITKVLPTKCCDAQTLARARNVCKRLGIPLHTLDLQEDFKCTVIDPFLAAYRSGLTPNPCVLCNRSFKFKHLLTLAKKLTCDKVATGHYARIVRRQGGFALLEASDKSKDQSYFLSRLTQKELSATLLPLGTRSKRETYALAKAFRIAVDPVHYRESQDICFVPEKSPAAFLRRYITNATRGPIRTLDGNKLGTHQGIPFYTIGQRRGLRIGGQRRPVHVVTIDQKNNTIFVAPSRALLTNNVSIHSLAFTRKQPRKNRPVRCTARIRARSRKVRGTLTFSHHTGLFRFDHPVSAATPGQAIVLYSGQEIIGGGLISANNSHSRRQKTTTSARITRRSL
ncbi:MAG: tRNA 2-thiouridine(34) synthase MnmA [Candidatus Peribacteraceae bacterium]|nr:tRNA 2-thiouridine(34) synthase MnmA [Candidatus Peribacteraceae bacterium]MDD5742654.1 tRNA 2-thiouridine(34) synthase MnmA [Candidatus Peribacteraceae bacterium]